MKVRGEPVDRETLGMFSVTREEWPGETFPDFCSDQVLPEICC